MYTIMYTFKLQCTLYRCKEEFNPPAWFHCTASLNHLMLVFSGKILTFQTLFTDSTLLVQHYNITETTLPSCSSSSFILQHIRATKDLSLCHKLKFYNTYFSILD